MDVSKLQGLHIHYLLQNFAEYVAMLPDDCRTSLSNCFKGWIAKGNVVEDCGGDFSTFLLIVTLAVTQFHEDPSFFGDGASDKITQIFNLDDPNHKLPECLDRDQWKEWVFRRQCGLPIEI